MKKIGKKAIIEFLKKNYNLEEEYEKNYGDSFNTIETGFQELVRVYLEYTVNWIWPTRIETCIALQKVALRRYLSELGKNPSDKDNILEFIKGEKKTSNKKYHPHQWHLGSFYKETAEILADDFINFYKNELPYLKDFEEVYESLDRIKNQREDIRRVVDGETRKLGFGQVCLYDTSLRMVYCFVNGEESHSLIPHTYVYLHAKPFRNARLLKKMGIIKGEISHRTKTDILQNIFNPHIMHPIDIENFLCVMNGPIRVLAGLPLKEKKGNK